MMLFYIFKRLLLLIPTMVIISVISFIIMQAPPGDYIEAYMATLLSTGETVDEEMIQSLRSVYGLDEPLYVQYWIWISNFVFGDFGASFEWNMKVSALIGDRLLLTIFISFITIIFTWFIALIIGFISAIWQYSFVDYFFTAIGFLGLAIPNFMLALILMYVSYKYFDVTVGGLFSPEYINAPWDINKFKDLLNHVWIPVIVIGTAGTAGLIRIMRANLLDEMRQAYVITGYAKGVNKWKVLIKYPLRIAINPFISTIGWLLPAVISGDIIVSVVLSLQTIGPLYLRALMAQDMYLAGAILMFLAFLTIIGTLISDILLAVIDPRIKYE